jgi:hypothetical protein
MLNLITMSLFPMSVLLSLEEYLAEYDSLKSSVLCLVGCLMKDTKHE